jgi:hypothetical protein
MGVVGPNTNRLLCEGKPDSLDYLLLQRLVGGTSFEVKPAGSKNGLLNFMDGFAAADSQRAHLVAFRDRDFDAEPGASAKLLQLRQSNARPIYMSHRTCVENYLLDPMLIHQYWDECTRGPKWTRGPSPTVDELRQWIEKAARDIADYQAVRWALVKIRPGIRWPSVRNTWVRNSGQLPNELDFKSCMNSALDLVKQFRCSVLPVNRRSLSAYASDYHQRFHDPQFWSSSEYLIWFQGKDIQKSMGRNKQNWISLDKYFEWATEKLDWQSHPDLTELNRLLCSYSSSSFSPP